jgi:hypothetical protein
MSMLTERGLAWLHDIAGGLTEMAYIRKSSPMTLFKMTALILILGLSILALPTAFAQGTDIISLRPPGDGPTRVEINFFLVDLMRVNDIDETFEADVFLVASWKDSRLAADQVRVVPANTVWMPNMVVFNKRDVSNELPEEVVIQPDGTVVYRQRLIGQFSSALDLRRFPMDSQTLKFRLIVYGAGVEEVALVESSQFPAARSPSLSIRDWTLGPLEVETGEFQPVPGSLVLSTFTIQLKTERLVIYYIVQMLIPLILIVGMAWAALWLDPSIIPTRISICVTTVLTLIAFRFMVGELVPKLPYLTIVDYVLLGTTILVAGCLTTIVVGSVLVKKNPETVTRIDRVARVLYPLVFLSVVLGTIFAS